MSYTAYLINIKREVNGMELTKNERELLDIIRQSDDPAEALTFVVKVITDFLEQEKNQPEGAKV